LRLRYLHTRRRGRTRRRRNGRAFVGIVAASTSAKIDDPIAHYSRSDLRILIPATSAGIFQTDVLSSRYFAARIRTDAFERPRVTGSRLKSRVSGAASSGDAGDPRRLLESRQVPFNTEFPHQAASVYPARVYPIARCVTRTMGQGEYADLIKGAGDDDTGFVARALRGEINFTLSR